MGGSDRDGQDRNPKRTSLRSQPANCLTLKDASDVSGSVLLPNRVEYRLIDGIHRAIRSYDCRSVGFADTTG